MKMKDMAGERQIVQVRHCTHVGLFNAPVVSAGKNAQGRELDPVSQPWQEQTKSRQQKEVQIPPLVGSGVAAVPPTRSKFSVPDLQLRSADEAHTVLGHQASERRIPKIS